MGVAGPCRTEVVEQSATQGERDEKENAEQNKKTGWMVGDTGLLGLRKERF